MKAGVLALQGDFREHARVLAAAGASPVEVRTPEELDGVDVPRDPRRRVHDDRQARSRGRPRRARFASARAAGMPVLGHMRGHDRAGRAGRRGRAAARVLDIAVRRNAYGRQVDSFEADVTSRGSITPCAACSSARRGGGDRDRGCASSPSTRGIRSCLSRGTSSWHPSTPSWSGTLFGNFGNRAMQATNLDDELRARGLLSVGELDRLWDASGSLGGPLKQNRLWFFTTVGWKDLIKTVPDSFRDSNLTDYVFTPDLAQPGIDDGYQKTANARVTWQASNRNKFSFSYDIHDKYRGHKGIISTIAPDSAVEYTLPLLNSLQTKWTSPVTSRFLLDAGYTLYFEDSDERFLDVGDARDLCHRGSEHGDEFRRLPVGLSISEERPEHVATRRLLRDRLACVSDRRHARARDTGSPGSSTPAISRRPSATTGRSTPICARGPISWSGSRPTSASGCRTSGRSAARP